MEAHGTGTALGDPIEVSSIAAIAADSCEACHIFGVKGNVGHTESTAGMANIIEVAGLLCRSETAVDVQLRALNPQVNQVRAEALEMPLDTHSMTGARSGGASSFGWSGIIAHGVFDTEL
jgi:acyl transferase domain-containing protein